MQNDLPPGAGPSMVNDNFGDVYGILFTISGQGYTYEELREYVKFLRKELLLVHNVAKVQPWGLQTEVIYIDMSHMRMAELGISPGLIVQTLAAQNQMAAAGKVLSGGQRLAIRPTGDFTDVEDIENLQIRDPSSDNIIYIKDVATVTRGYLDPPRSLMHYDAAPALALGVSVVPGGNVVELGEAIRAKLTELEKFRPIGMEFGIVNFQPRDVTQAVNGFAINFVESLVIVIVVLLVFMGMRSGLLIGMVLVLTVLGTMIVMNGFSINLQRVSLGALGHRVGHVGGQRDRDLRGHAGACHGRPGQDEGRPGRGEPEPDAAARRHHHCGAGLRGHWGARKTTRANTAAPCFMSS